MWTITGIARNKGSCFVANSPVITGKLRDGEVIGSQGGFVVEIGSLDEDAKPFRLDI